MSHITTWLVTGASRGLGLALVRHILTASENNVVFASCRDPAAAKGLLDLTLNGAFKKENLLITKMDVADEKSIIFAAKEVEKVLEEKHLPLDYVINNAGATFANDTPLTMKSQSFVDVMTLNVLGPTLVTQHFMPFLEKSTKPVLMNMSSGLGSIDQTGGTHQTSYSLSKTTLNMLTRKLAKEKPNVISFVMAPGWVRTDMGGPSAALDIDFSVSNMLKVILSVTLNDSGSFKRYDGSTVPW